MREGFIPSALVVGVIPAEKLEFVTNSATTLLTEKNHPHFSCDRINVEHQTKKFEHLAEAGGKGNEGKGVDPNLKPDAAGGSPSTSENFTDTRKGVANTVGSTARVLGQRISSEGQR